MVIVNYEYSTAEYNDLDNPKKDGELVTKLLEDGGYQHITLLENEEDIENVIKELIETQEETKHLERFHFHYSGHGTRNTTVHVDKNKFIRKLTEDGYETVNAAKEDSVGMGDCIVGSGGKLYLVEQLKIDLLKLSCDTWTVTLDMCRNEGKTQVRSKQETIEPVESIRKVELR